MTDEKRQLGGLVAVGRTALCFAALAAVGLAGMLFLLDLGGSGYRETSRSLSLTRRELPDLMALAGLVLASLTGLSTWLITLYSSFRVAGPLYRFTRNLELAAGPGRASMHRIRGDDRLQADARALEQTVQGLYRYHEALERCLDEAGAALDDDSDDSPEAALTRLAEAVARPRL